jgi:hypothetical protein
MTGQEIKQEWVIGFPTFICILFLLASGWITIGDIRFETKWHSPVSFARRLGIIVKSWLTLAAIAVVFTIGVWSIPPDWYKFVYDAIYAALATTTGEVLMAAYLLAITLVVYVWCARGAVFLFQSFFAEVPQRAMFITSRKGNSH